MKTEHRPTLEERQAEWLKQPGAFVTRAEREFIESMRQFADRGVGYGWMQQHIEWEWEAKSAGSLGPEYFERQHAALTERVRVLEEALREIYNHAEKYGAAPFTASKMFDRARTVLEREKS